MEKEWMVSVLRRKKTTGAISGGIYATPGGLVAPVSIQVMAWCLYWSVFYNSINSPVL